MTLGPPGQVGQNNVPIPNFTSASAFCYVGFHSAKGVRMCTTLAAIVLSTTGSEKLEWKWWREASNAKPRSLDMAFSQNSHKPLASQYLCSTTLTTSCWDYCSSLLAGLLTSHFP